LFSFFDHHFFFSFCDCHSLFTFFDYLHYCAFWHGLAWYQTLLSRISITLNNDEGDKNYAKMLFNMDGFWKSFEKYATKME
jgi:hypothetical protein